MFKRVARRIRKKEEEEELGLNEEMKEVLGMHDTDSEESDSDSEDDGESGGSQEDDSEEDSNTESADSAPLPVAGHKRRRDESDEGSGSEKGAEDDSEGEAGDEDSDEDEDENEDEGESDNEAEIPISIAEASKDPIYAIPRQPEVEACALCPGKLLKNPRMVSAHTQSNAHKRRHRKFVELAADAEPEDDVVDILRLLSQPVAQSEQAEAEGLSRRAAKRKAKQASIRDKRVQHKKLKAKALAKKKTKADPQSKKPSSPAKANTEAAPATASLTPAPRKKKRRTHDSVAADPSKATAEAGGIPAMKATKSFQATPKQAVPSLAKPSARPTRDPEEKVAKMAKLPSRSKVIARKARPARVAVPS